MARLGPENRSFQASPAISRGWLGALAFVGLGAVNCYSTGDGTSPPLDQFYFPVGLQVSAGGGVLYAVNSDFDLQYNGGTLQSYDLNLIRQHTLDIIADPTSPNPPILDRVQLGANPCPARSPSLEDLGQTCAPPVDSSFYVRDTAIVGAFATDLVLSLPPGQLVPQNKAAVPPAGTRRFDRLFAPVRGNASITWANVERDRATDIPPAKKGDFYAPFYFHCGQDSVGRCDGAHMAGEDPNESGNSRHITMPGEPFGVALSQDGEALVVTHQADTKTSLFDTGLTRTQADGTGDDFLPHPSLQFVLDGLPLGSVGVTNVPHDPDAYAVTDAFPKSAFLQTSNYVAEIDLVREYPDQVGNAAVGVTNASTRRPFLDRETAFTVAVGAGGTDSRGIAIDPTPRLACKAKIVTAGRTDQQIADDKMACARKPARVFVANRTPAALLVGEIGDTSTSDVSYDADRLVLHSSIPLSAGPSRLYLAPVVESDGAYGLRVFIVCFDSATVFVYNPDTEQVENIIRVGLGPFAMAFDPFSFDDVARHVKVPLDTRDVSNRGLRSYRFAYLASFTNSFVQVIDLDDAQVNRQTFEKVVFTLGRPQTPKGS